MSAVKPEPSQGLWSRAMMAVLSAQFLCALALLKSNQYPAWSSPLLQEFFVAAYIVLAPFAGPIADSFAKGRVMLLANGVKLMGAAGMLLGLNPFVAYGLVGVGAAMYAPAKYGILTELTSPVQLVKANGLMESSTIAAILIGAVAGGVLADWSVPGTLAVVAACYGVATLATMLIPYLAPERPLASLAPGLLLRGFVQSARVLMLIPDARLSLAGTSLFWSAGATMRLLLVAWVPVALGITTNSMPAYLNAGVAVGIVAGAVLAGRYISMEKADRTLPVGVLIGAVLCLMAVTHSTAVAVALMVAMGACGGFYVVPLNALLQERGHETVGSGNAIAFQGFCESVLVLLMLGSYTLAVRAGASVTTTVLVFGIGLSVSIAALWWWRAAQARGSKAPT
jgi:MFS transporter, LPLT family, lysophospholipid transporter